jgi:hypothetical protein
MLRVLELSTQSKGKTMSAITEFITRNIIAADPAPEYSRLDLMDIPLSGGCFHGRHNLCNDHDDTPNCGCGCHL